MPGDMELSAQVEMVRNTGRESLTGAGEAVEAGIHAYFALRRSSSLMVGREMNGKAPPR